MSRISPQYPPQHILNQIPADEVLLLMGGRVDAEYLSDAEPHDITLPDIAHSLIALAVYGTPLIAVYLWTKRKAIARLFSGMLLTVCALAALWMALWFQAVEMAGR
jgi:hypothetical protein